jgi:hypothetical protein
MKEPNKVAQRLKMPEHKKKLEFLMHIEIKGELSEMPFLLLGGLKGGKNERLNNQSQRSLFSSSVQ